MSPEQGAESALWASTASALESGDEKVVQKYQGAYLTQPDDSVRVLSSSRRAQRERGFSLLTIPPACRDLARE